MKKSYWLISAIALSIGVASCSKSDNSGTTTPTNNLPTNYKIDGLSDVSVQSEPDSNTSISTLVVSSVSKTQEKVTLSLEGLPNGCTGSFSNTNGYPNFSTTLTIKDESAQPGVYPVKLNCEGSSTGKKNYVFNLTVRPERNYAYMFIGTKTGSMDIPNSPDHYTIGDSISLGDRTNRIVFRNFGGYNVSVYADITDKGASLEIPVQTINNVTYYGDGFFLKANNYPLTLDYTCYKVVGNDTTRRYIVLQ